jgi:hypothetical protein
MENEMKKLIFIAFAALMCAGTATAHDGGHKAKAGKLMVTDSWVRMTMTGRPAGGYMIVHNMGDAADRLVGAATPMAERVELHTHIKDGDVMKMRRVAHVDVPPRGKVTFRTGSYHLMIFGLKHAMKKGDMLPLTLTFEKAGRLDIKARIRAVKGGAMKHGDGGMGKSMQHDKGHGHRSHALKPSRAGAF